MDGMSNQCQSSSINWLGSAGDSLHRDVLTAVVVSVDEANTLATLADLQHYIFLLQSWRRILHTQLSVLLLSKLEQSHDSNLLSLVS